MKPKSSIQQTSISKSQILQWVNSILNSNETKVQSFGNGIVYCLLMNHFYQSSVPKNKIIMVPRNNMDNKSNLRRLQQALNLYNIKSITFDIFRVSEMSYLDNWQLICKLYRYFEQIEKTSEKQQDKNIMNISNNMLNQNFPLSNQTNIINQQSLTLSKQISKAPQLNTGLLTPMKGLKYFDQNTKLRLESLRLMQEIKTIVKSEAESDKIKVNTLKKMLGLIEQQSQQQQQDLKQLFSDCKQKQQIITID